MKRALAFVQFVLFAGLAFAQGVRVNDNNFTTATNVPPGAQAPLYSLPNSKVTICAYPGTPGGNAVCTNTVPIYSDIGLTVPITQPGTGQLIANSQGKYGFFIAPGTYTESVQNAAGTWLANYTLTLSSGGGSSLPTASSPGQIISSTAAGTTYAVQPQIFFSQTTDTPTSINAECSSLCTYVVTNHVPLSGTVVLNSNVQLEGRAGGQFTGTYALTVSSHIVTAPATVQLFSSTGTVSGLLTARPEWFGAINTSAAFLAAYNSVVTNGQLLLGIGNYISPFPSGVGLSKTVQIMGTQRPQFDSQTAPTALQNGSIIKGPFFASAGFTLKNVGIDAGSAYNGGSCTYGLFLARDHAQPAGYIYGVDWENISVLTCGVHLDGGHGTLIENTYGAIVKDYYFMTTGADYGLIIKGVNGSFSNIHVKGPTGSSILCKADYATFADGNCQNNRMDGYWIENLATIGDTAGPNIDNQYDNTFGNTWMNGHLNGLQTGWHFYGLGTFTSSKEKFIGLTGINMQNVCVFNDSGVLASDIQIADASCEVITSGGAGFSFVSGASKISLSNVTISSSNSSTLSGVFDSTNSGSVSVNGAKCFGFTGACVDSSNASSTPTIASNITVTTPVTASSGQVYDQHNNPVAFNADLYSDGVNVRCLTTTTCTPYTFRDQFGNVQGFFTLAVPGVFSYSNIIATNALNPSYLSSTTNPLCYLGSTITNVGCGTTGLALTTTGSSGAATLVGSTLNIPVYTGGGGSGTVTSFSAGNLSPLFTTSVATATTTPALTFALSNAAQNSIFAGPPTGGAGAPSFQTAPVFSAALLTGFPTFNQNTTGSAAKWTTARNLAGNSVDGSANVAFANKFIVQGTTDSGLSGAQFLGAIATGILKNTTTTGVLSAAASSDVYGLWSGTCSSSTFLRGDGACATATGSTGISGLTANYIPKAGSSTTITANSAMDDGVTTAATITSTEPIVAPSYTASGTTPGSASYGAGTGSIPTLLANSGGFAAPVTGGTAYLYKLPATAVAGILHAAAPGTVDGVNESALTSSAVSLTADVTGLLPHANIASTAVTPGSYTSANITVAADGSITAAANGSGGGAVSSVSNSDSTLTVSPTTGAVVASLNLAHANTFTAAQSAPAFIGTGTTAGFVDYAQGSTSAAVAPCNVANSWCVQAPASLSSNFIETLETPATGFRWRTLSGSTITDTPGTSANLITLWSGTCSSSTFLRGDGACAAGGGGDTITSPNATLGVGGTSSATTLDVLGATGKILAGSTPALTFTPALGVDNTSAGTLQMANGSANAHTIWGSGATTSNTILGFATAPANGELVSVNVSGTTSTLADAGVLAANVVAAASTLTSNQLALGGGSKTVATLGSLGTTTTVLHGNAAGAPSFGAVVGADMTNNTVTATQLAAQYSKGSCMEVWGGSGTSFALVSGDDAISNNSCYNDSGVTRTITAVKCLSDNASNTTTVNPTFGASGTGTTILSGALTCGNSNAMSSSGTVSNASWTTGTGVNPAMAGTLTGTHIGMIVEYTF